GIVRWARFPLAGRSIQTRRTPPMIRQAGLRALIAAFALTAGAAVQGQEEAPPPERARPTRTPEGHPLRDQWKASGTRGAVAAGGAEATAAGLEILQGGGNAADAAAATILALSVTDANAFCFGGEVP